ncbi:hypothetical protein [Streptomyces hyaluromycini]|uniref:hypothetical protein n=1 Tax=Streptomyces hyaluromycini TaxID=1377993 RepID=UPI0034CD1C43
MIGAALGGLQTALLLARDGHDVTVLERDPEPPPADPESSWSRWERPGIPQLRLLHLPLARWRQLAEAGEDLIDCLVGCLVRGVQPESTAWGVPV